MGLVLGPFTDPIISDAVHAGPPHPDVVKAERNRQLREDVEIYPLGEWAQAAASVAIHSVRHPAQAAAAGLELAIETARPHLANPTPGGERLVDRTAEAVLGAGSLVVGLASEGLEKVYSKTMGGRW